MKESLVYACYNKDEKLRQKGSSGSVFYLLAHYVISCGGVVFGARFDENWEVMHDKASTEEELFPLMGSKYLPSNVKETYQKGRILFKTGNSGTLQRNTVSNQWIAFLFRKNL